MENLKEVLEKLLNLAQPCLYEPWTVVFLYDTTFIHMDWISEP